ncbi:addiction module antitoxin, RelB/DinJ family [Leptotrichia wadei]|jgi:addiction module antitoxin, relB/dinJ family|uniref:Addiction module antitoxin, RelB/DinJ family n=1 Tax=Leptotrichia wadei TaxID=157687 RepID=A0A134A9N5_9FUSO|nr:type II toxin-antitoxin system RelB/DinJ family antitoxin [Leptotrichia wadei]KXB64439.1 addiction module antitoxin, RelB/DinJ family [Leptotrichia wadei]BBM43905.1 possible DNA damage-inducible protein [Leptotrichia wadei]
MEKVVVNFRIDKDTKKEMEEICKDIGISIGTAFNIFAKKFTRERKMPFELDAAPFYSQKNIERLKKSIEQMEKTGGTVHEIDYD